VSRLEADSKVREEIELRNDKIKEFTVAAKQELEDSHSITPKIFAIMPDKTMAIFLMMFKNTKEKEVIRDNIKKLILEKGCEEYVIVMETWLSQVNVEKNPEEALMQPRLNPKKKEAIMITHIKKGDKPKMGATIFEMNLKNEYVFDETIIMDDGGQTFSYWDIFQEENEVDKEMHESKIKAREQLIKNVSKELSGKFYQKFKAAKTEAEILDVLKDMIEEGRHKIEEKTMTLEDMENEPL
jgi:hypothetical protein